jgi:hypothetical protein
VAVISTLARRYLAYNPSVTAASLTSRQERQPFEFDRFPYE